MKKITTKTLVGLLFIFCISCHNEMQYGQKNSSDLVFHAGVGEPIPFGTAARWIENYNEKFAGAREGQTYKVTQPMLDAMMRSTSGLIGFTFHHALDNFSKHHIIIVPIDNSLRLWASESQRILVDSNTDDEIDINVARNWIDNYTATYPNAIRYHFFGADIFNEIVESPEFAIEEAINDEQIPQMLLVIRNNGENSARTSSTDLVYDLSVRCPSNCVQ